MRINLVVMVLIVLILPLSGCAYLGGPWKGKVLDVETKEPLEGAVVLMFLERQFLTPAGRSSYFYDASEAVTGKNGEFELPSYFSINMIPLISYIDDPVFVVYKPGYGSLNRMAIGGYLTGAETKAQDMKLSEKMYRLAPGVIELPRLKTIEERRSVSTAPVGHEKDWIKQKMLIKTLRQEWGDLTGRDPSNLYLMKEDKK